IRWHLGNKPLGIEFAQRVFADASCKNGNVIDVSILDHGGEGVLGVVSGKLVPHMFIPEIAQKFRAKARLCTGLRFVIHMPGRKRRSHLCTRLPSAPRLVSSLRHLLWIKEWVGARSTLEASS